MHLDSIGLANLHKAPTTLTGEDYALLQSLQKHLRTAESVTIEVRR